MKKPEFYVNKTAVEQIQTDIAEMETTMRQKKKSFLKIVVCAICTFSLLYISTYSVFAASFDCSKARSYTEKTICSNPELSSADSRLGRIYEQAKLVQGNSKQFRDISVANLQKRETTCHDISCIRAWYISSAYLYEGYAGNHRTTPGFDCDKAKSYSEITICNSPELTAAGSRMGELYAQAKVEQGNSQYFRNVASENLQNLAKCRDISCIHAWYINTAYIYEGMLGGNKDGGYAGPAPVAPSAPPAQNASATVEQACVFIVTDNGGTGSGFFVAPGYVVTNAHVVAGANRILVTSQAMLRPAYALVVAASSDGSRDYAVLRLDPSVCGDIRPLVFAGEPKRTEHVGAWGFPGLINETDPNYYRFMQGDFSATPVVSYTEGVVSALVGRNPTMIVHTAPISPGNSGGPLVNVNGDVLGINTWGKRADRSYHQASIAISSSDLLFFLRNSGIPAQSR